MHFLPDIITSLEFSAFTDFDSAPLEVNAASGSILSPGWIGSQ